MANDKHTTVAHLVELATQAKNHTDQEISALGQELLEALEAMDLKNADKPTQMALTLAVDGWAANTDEATKAEYPYQYTLTVSGVDDTTQANALLDDASAAAAGRAGCSTCVNTVTDGVVFRARSIPEQALTGRLDLIYAETTNEEG